MTHLCFSVSHTHTLPGPLEHVSHHSFRCCLLCEVVIFFKLIFFSVKVFVFCFFFLSHFLLLVKTPQTPEHGVCGVLVSVEMVFAGLTAVVKFYVTVMLVLTETDKVTNG